MGMMELENETLVYERPDALTKVSTHYCPGCTHGIAHRLIAEVIDEMGMRDRMIGVASVGCSVFAYNYFDFDFIQAPHGRAPAMATGVKRVLHDRVVMTYQVTATWPPSAWRKLYMLPPVVKISRCFLSIIPITA